MLCGADAPPGRAPRGNLARELSRAITMEKGKTKAKARARRERVSRPR